MRALALDCKVSEPAIYVLLEGKAPSSSEGWPIEMHVVAHMALRHVSISKAEQCSPKLNVESVSVMVQRSDGECILGNLPDLLERSDLTLLIHTLHCP